jgi:S1-C subfamily serine protease
MFGNSKNLSNSVSADEVKSSPVPDDIGGIRLTRIPKESVLAQIGVEVGDIVRDVNGQPVKSTDDLLECLKNPPLGLPTIRIERLKSDGLIDPIYIELH